MKRFLRMFIICLLMSAGRPALFPFAAGAAGDRETRGGQTRIYGGRPVTPGAYPWMAGIGYTFTDHPFCGGALIDPGWVITAAHCVYGERPEDLAVILGAHEFRDPSAVRIEVERIVLDPDYDDFTTDRDAALIKLDRPAAGFEPIPLYTRTDSPTGKTARVLGWGQTKTRPNAEVLTAVDVPVVDIDMCRTLYDEDGYNGPDPVTENMLCAGFPGKDACIGDSGGPLITTDDDAKWKLIGIISWGGNDTALCGGELPGVYTRIPAITDFVNTYVDLEIAGGECAVIDDTHRLTIPCLSYRGNRYRASFDLSTPPGAGACWRYAPPLSSPAETTCVEIHDSLHMSLPCVLYRGTKYTADLAPLPPPHDRSGLYWSVTSSRPVRERGCARFDAAGHLTIFCAEFRGVKYRLYMARHENPVDRSGFHVAYRSGDAVFGNGPCGVLHDDLSIQLPCINGIEGETVLLPRENPADPGGYYWQIVFP